MDDNLRRARRFVPAAGALALGLAAREAVARLREEDLTGQVALVTGSSRGLGLALARHLADQGCRLVLCARDEEELERARAELAARGAEVLAVRADVGDRADVARLIDEATRRFGRVDLLINNAGFIQVGPLQSATPEDFQNALDTMFFGVLYPTLAVLPQMQARRSGRIVNINSIGGRISMPHLIPYNAAKFAAVGLSEGLRAELAADGIRVTTVLPGEMRTGSHLNAFFSGPQQGEYRWFGFGASLPTITSAEKAACLIVRAAKRGEAERIFPASANILVRLHSLFPGTTANILHGVNRLLPSAEGVATGTNTARGSELDESLRRSRLWRALTAKGRDAARDLNQNPGPLAVMREGSYTPRPASDVPASGAPSQQ